MSLQQGWRQFTFFEKFVVKDPEHVDQDFLGFQDVSIVCSHAGNGQAFLGDSKGGIYMLEKNWNFSFFKGYEVDLTHMIYINKHAMLFTVGCDDPGINPLLKVWFLDKLDKQGKPYCARIIKCAPNNRPTKVTSVAVHHSLNYLVVGFEDSTILLYKGEIVRERYSNRPQTLRDGLTCAAEGPVNGLAFHGDLKKDIVLFVVTSTLVLVYNINGKDQESKTILDRHGCAPRCWSLGGTDLDHQFIIARNDAVYCYQPPNLKSQCYIFEGEKIMIKTAGSYLVSVTKGVISKEDSATITNTVTVYDLTNSFIACVLTSTTSEVVDIIWEWNSFYVMYKNGKIWQLKEKDVAAKLDILFHRNLYDVAISLAKRQQHYSEDALAEIYKQYGDYLFQKNDFNNAVRQYIKTIGKLESSYVMRKFLNAQRVPQLTNYLEELHKLGVATEDHTTILLNCYAKLSDSSKLQQFVKESANEVFFDVETAIRVLRRANYKNDALSLARLHKQHDSALHIMLEDMKRYREAVRYIEGLDFEHAEQAVKNYGKILMAEVPDETVAVLKHLCTARDGAGECRASADQFIHIFVNDSLRLQQFLEHIIAQDSASCPPVIYNTLLELYLREYNQKDSITEKLTVQEKIMRFLENPNSAYQLDHALILCQSGCFSPGMLYIYEKANLLPQVIQHHISMRDYPKVIETCKKYGTDKSHRGLWLQALCFFVRSDDCSVELISELLSHIDLLGILPLLMVIEILSKSHCVTLAVVKQYLLNWLKKENEQIQKDEALIQEYKEEIQKTEALIENLRISGQVFQISRCSACQNPLDIPTVHFLCKHSFHLHCYEGYGDAEINNECPICFVQNKKLREQFAARAQTKDAYLQFRSEIESAGNSLSVVADYFGRGMFGNPASKAKIPASSNMSASSLPSQDALHAGLKTIDSRPKEQPSTVIPSTNPFEDFDDD